MRILQLEHVGKQFSGSQEAAVDDLCMSVEAGEIFTLLGPSGCGKTTTLRLIAGFETPDTGSIAIQGKSVAGNGAWVNPERRGVGFVFQDLALFPHLTVADNIAFGLRKVSIAERNNQVCAWVERLGLDSLEQRLPHQLSGGQQQRVALARALAPKPQLLLLDEPFSSLDAALRTALRSEFRALFKETGTTALLVTHDQAEALAFSDRIAVMRDGRIIQVGDPPTLYRRPSNRFVAAFIGRSNLIPARRVAGGIETSLGTVKISSSESDTGAVSAVAFKPSQCQVAPNHTSVSNGEFLQFSGIIHSIQYAGACYELEVICQTRWPGGTVINIVAELPIVGDLKSGNVITLIVPKDGLVCLQD